MTDDEPRASTGDAVLDRMLNGGVPQNRAVLLAGAPGTGKTTLGMQFLQAGLEAGERCLFVSTEQSRDELRESFAGYAFDLDHEELALTSLHASPDWESSAGRQLRLRTLEGDTIVDDQFVEFTLSNITEYLRNGASADRIVVDSVSALEVLTEQDGLFRRYLLELLQTLTNDIEATTVLTAEADRDGYAADVLEYSTHGVIRLTREAVNGDPHRFLEVAKMRGVDHDPRTVEFTLGESFACAPARRSQPPALKTHKHTPIGIEGLDSLCGGGLATGAGVMLQHDGRANLTALFSQLISQAVGRGYSIVLVPTIRMRPESTRRLLSGHDISLEELIADDRLFVLDMIGAWGEIRNNVFGAREAAGGVDSVLQAIHERAGDQPTLSLINADAIVNQLGAAGAREVRYAQETRLGPDDLLLHVHNPAVTAEVIDGFYTNAAEQVIKTWVTEGGLQYVSVEKSPCGFVGTTSMVEYIEEPPYLTVQMPPEERENPYAEK
jgi:KaiC/GvpD/RAD55 family RecA-like ATPase